MKQNILRTIWEWIHFILIGGFGTWLDIQRSAAAHYGYYIKLIQQTDWNVCSCRPLQMHGKRNPAPTRFKDLWLITPESKRCQLSVFELNWGLQRFAPSVRWDCARTRTFSSTSRYQAYKTTSSWATAVRISPVISAARGRGAKSTG